MRTVVIRGAFSTLIMAFICLVAPGCATSDRAPAPKQQEPGYAAEAKIWKPYLLYRLNSPYRRLYVEVDSVKGCEPSDATMAELRNVLTNFCDKPDGIEIVRNPPIPRKREPGLTPEQLACHVMKGPPTNTASDQPAFMEILFYDSALFAPLTERVPRGRSLKVRHPQTDCLPYPGIFVNTRYFIADADPLGMRHEAGHILGLVTRTNAVDNGHCADPNCIMYKKIMAVFHIFRWLRGESPYTVAPKDFCERCRAELDADAKLPPSKLRFVGPVLVRSEPGYDVLALPNFIEVIVGGLTNGDLETFKEAARTNTDPSIRFTATVRHMDTAEFVETAERAGADRYWLVRNAMALLCENAGMLTNAMDIYRQSIRLDPDDAASYDGLAWIEAASPDASLRDARQAVLDAEHACELADWKDAGFIDTLAAACAESGDFKRAIEYERRAMSVAASRDPKNRERLDRLSAYKQSKPVRMQ